MCLRPTFHDGVPKNSRTVQRQDSATDLVRTYRSGILSQLEQDARRLHVARPLPDGPLTWQWLSQVRDDFKRFVSTYEFTLTDVARRMGRGYSASVLSNFQNIKSPGTHIGDVDRIARGLNQWMETYCKSLDTPRPKGWVETAVARRMLALIRNAIELCEVGVIYGDAGRGKTMTLEAAASIYRQAILIRVTRSTRSPLGIARQLGHELRIMKGRTLYELQQALCDRLRGSGRPILIDEAHQLSHDALEFVRDLYDLCHVPVVLVGTATLMQKCNDATEFFGQFASRIVLRYDVTEHLRHSSPGPGSGPNPAVIERQAGGEIMLPGKKYVRNHWVRRTDNHLQRMRHLVETIAASLESHGLLEPNDVGLAGWLLARVTDQRTGRLDCCDYHDLHRAINSLRSYAQRHGVQWKTSASTTHATAEPVPAQTFTPPVSKELQTPGRTGFDRSLTSP